MAKKMAGTRYTRTSSARAAFFDGASRVVGGGEICVHRANGRIAQNDTDALRGDWEQVGQYLERGIERHVEGQRKKER